MAKIRAKGVSRERFVANLVMRHFLSDSARFSNPYSMRCVRAGKIVWEEPLFFNLVPDAALNDVLDVYLSAGTQKTFWYLGIKGTGDPDPSDTAGSHAGWSEITAYDEATRQAWTDGGVSAQSVSNTGSPAALTINGTVTIAGGFLISNNTKGGSTGLLFSVADFGTPRQALDNDILYLVATFGMASA